jgi:sn-glycerol 3-phosphate transport system ATP-binding protein
MGADYLLHVSTPIGTLRFSRRHRGAVPEKGESLILGFRLPMCIFFMLRPA